MHAGVCREKVGDYSGALEDFSDGKPRTLPLCCPVLCCPVHCAMQLHCATL
jgi:hypothetical protein